MLDGKAAPFEEASMARRERPYVVCLSNGSSRREVYALCSLGRLTPLVSQTPIRLGQGLMRTKVS